MGPTPDEGIKWPAVVKFIVKHLEVGQTEIHYFALLGNSGLLCLADGSMKSSQNLSSCVFFCLFLSPARKT